MEPTTYSPPAQRREPEFTEPLPEGELKKLLKRSRAGDSLAFARLYGFYSKRVYEYTYFNVGDEQTADDLAACVFLKSWRSINCYDPERQRFGAWLYLIARSVLMDFAGHQGNASPVMDVLSPADEGLAAFGPDGPCSPP